jgi:hypothetical protein
MLGEQRLIGRDRLVVVMPSRFAGGQLALFALQHLQIGQSLRDAHAQFGVFGVRQHIAVVRGDLVESHLRQPACSIGQLRGLQIGQCRFVVLDSVVAVRPRQMRAALQ